MATTRQTTHRRAGVIWAILVGLLVCGLAVWGAPSGPAAAEPLAQTQGTITVEAPAPGATVTSPVAIRGRVSALPPSGALVASVYDSQGRLIGQDQITLSPPGAGQPITFAVQLPFAIMDGEPGRVEVSEFRTNGAFSLATANVAVSLDVPDASWLDRPQQVNWNGHLNPVPQAPRPMEGDVTAVPDPQCTAGERPPAGEEEAAVTAAGWRLFDAPATPPAPAALRIVSGLSGYDGMCRPMGYQQFLFAEGATFIGTISPMPMSSREDGAGAVRALTGSDTLTAAFSRYGPDDPACCPSRETVVTYRIERGAAWPLLVPVSAVTGPPGAAPQPAPQPAPGATLAPGAVFALRGTPHLWVAGEDGALHWVGDTRALAEHRVEWATRQEVGLDQLRALPRSDPWLSAGLVRIGAPIYLAKWEQSESAPTLLHIQSIGDVELFGITAANYGRFVLDEGPWNQRYGFTAAALQKGVLSPAAPAPGPGAAPCAGQLASAEGVQVCLPPGVATGVTGSREARNPAQEPGAREARRVLTLQGYPVTSERGDPATISVFALADFDRPGAQQAANVQALRRVLAQRPAFSGLTALPADGPSLPTLIVEASTPYLARPQYLDLPWGTGVRGVGQTDQSFNPPRSGDIQYLFGGISADGRWLVVGYFPLAAPGIPTISEDTALNNPQSAIALVYGYLSQLDDSGYTPRLAALDELMRSLTVQGP